MADMKRIYVVEKANKASLDQQADERGLVWWSVGTYDHPADAGHHAAELKAQIDSGAIMGARVRQFWVSSTPPTQKPLRAGETAPVDVPMVDLTCVDHPDVRVKVYKSAHPPRCKYCSKYLVPPSFEDAITDGEVINLEDI